MLKRQANTAHIKKLLREAAVFPTIAGTISVPLSEEKLSFGHISTILPQNGAKDR
jgi:hypothetical protein